MDQAAWNFFSDSAKKKYNIQTLQKFEISQFTNWRILRNLQYQRNEVDRFSDFQKSVKKYQ